MSFGIGVGDILKLCEVAGRVYRNCRDCTGDYKSLVSEARSLTNILGDIADKYDKIPKPKCEQFVDAYEPCFEVLDELDKLLTHYNGLDTKSKRAWDRLKYDPDRIRTLRARLASSVVMLNTFYTGLIHDSQVLILEALERLEKDYRGGHREESIASLERITSDTGQDDDADEEDAAWTQIFRDLEDVGVSQQEALGYRDFIVDWLVAAVNQGRLLEQRSEPDAYTTLSRDFEDTLPSLNVEPVQTYRLEVPVALPPFERNQSLPVIDASTSTLQPPLLAIPTCAQRTSTVSLPVSLRSSTSNDTPPTSETDASSLYSRPHPSPNSKPSFQIKRVPVPQREVREMYEEEVAPMLPFMPPDVHPKASTTTNESTLEAVHPSPWPALSSLETAPVPAPFSTPPSRPTPAFTSPPGYHDKEASIPADIGWTVHQIIAAWARHDFVTAERHLEDQLAAVERGYTLASGTQPDRRVLRHLLGVCASFAGNFTKAKRLFESVFNGVFLNRGNLDEGDIAAARWLGDVCLHLREHHNALLAYSVAFEGSLGRFGVARDVTSRVAAELRLFDNWLYAFNRIEHSFRLNVDPTDIFMSTHAVEKSNLLVSTKALLYDNNPSISGAPVTPYAQPTMQLSPRARFEIVLPEGFLTGPLISLSTWPYPWDPTFSPFDVVQLDRNMNTFRTSKISNRLVERQCPTASLGDSKKLHFVTKRGQEWLIETVKQGLRDMGIEHAERPFVSSIVCCLNQHHNGFAFSQGVEICFRKLSFRNVYGIKVTNTQWATRRFHPDTSADVSDFTDLLRGILQSADADSDVVLPVSSKQGERADTRSQTPNVPPRLKQPLYG